MKESTPAHRLQAVILFVMLIGCSPPPPTESRVQAISGGALHDGHPAVGRLQSGGEFICGGILVGVRTALTSAHCVKEGPMSLVLDGGATISVESAVQHPDFTSEEIFADMYRDYYDVAVLRLTEDAPGEAATVSGLPPLRGAEITLVGFGATHCDIIDAGTDAQPELSCQHDLQGKQIATNTIEQVYGHEFSIAGAGNACKGDSGGAVLGTADGIELVIGIPAHSKMPCGVRSYASRLDAFVPWLLEVSEGDIQVHQPALGDGGVTPGGDADGAASGDAGDNCARWGVCGALGTRSLQEGCGCRAVPAPGASLAWALVLALAVALRRRFGSR